MITVSSSPRTVLQISSQQSLQMVVYVLGCPVEGEMIVTVIRDEEGVKYSTLTDCYLVTLRHAKIFAEWCKSIGVSQFNAIIFTHPDADHCTGVQYLVEELDTNHSSKLFIPNQMFAVMSVSHDKVLAPFKKVLKYYDKNGTLCLQRREPLESNTMLEIEFQTPLHSNSIMRFIQLATDERYVFQHNLYRAAKASHNDLSLVYAINYQGVNYLYCADLPGSYVKELDCEYLHNISFVKIPHHGSKDCMELPSRLLANEETDVLSASTIFHRLSDKGKLPHNEVLDRYQKLGSVYCTGPNVKNISKKTYKYGGIMMCYALHGEERNVGCGGNAYQYQSDAE